MKKEVKLYYENKEKNSMKLYHIRENIGGNSCTAWYGRLGSPLRSIVYPIEKFDRKVEEKLKKGYKEMSGVTYEI